MTRFFPNIYLDLSSFWAGIILVIILLFVFLKYRKRLSAFLSRMLTGIKDFRESLSITSDSDYIQVLYKYIQGLHIISDYFPLDSIIVPAKCVAPPPYLFPGNTRIDTSLIQQVIGYDPLLPELNSEYFGPTFPLIDAVRTGTDLCLIGLPGTGKTTAIAECISGLIRPCEPDDESEDEPPAPKIPFYVKAHHLLAQFPNQDMLGILLKALQLNKAFQVIPNFAKYLTISVDSGQSILFIDDMDSLPLGDINRLANFISALHYQFPSLQVVATASPSCLGKLVLAPLEFITISPWNNQDKYLFLEKLSGLWSSTQPEEYEEKPDNYTVLSSMLVVSSRNLTPLEFTMNSISAFEGNVSGSTASHALQAFIERSLSLSETAVNTLELIAVYCLDRNTSTFSRKDLNSWFYDVYKKNNRNPAGITSTTFQPVLQAAYDQNILWSCSDNRYRFKLSTVAGFLAARGLSISDPSLVLRVLQQPDWGPLHECMRFFSEYNDIKLFLKPLLSDKTLLKRNMHRASYWLENAKHNSPEEAALLKQLTREIQSNTIYLVKIRLICSMVKSSNPQIKAILQHLQKSPDVDTRRAAAVGLGLLQDLSAVPVLIKQLNDTIPSSIAACYALGKIGSPRSLEAIAEALLHGSELLRRAAAESLAQNRSEGHPALREGATMDDLLVRHAVVHGLSMINESWGLEILDKMRIDEKEWVVRDLAQQTHEILTTQSPYIPQPTPPAHETPWLHEFTTRQSLPPLTPENALDHLLKALDLGFEEQKQDALAHLSRSAKPDLIPVFQEFTRSDSFVIAHQAALTIWLYSSHIQNHP